MWPVVIKPGPTVDVAENIQAAVSTEKAVTVLVIIVALLKTIVQWLLINLLSLSVKYYSFPTAMFLICFLMLSSQL